MSRLLVAVLGALLAVSVGCQTKNEGGASTDAQMMSADACPKCEGVQQATADGKCAMCEAKKAGKTSATGAGASMDACTHCAGMQTATAKGKCPECNATVAAK